VVLAPLKCVRHALSGRTATPTSKPRRPPHTVDLPVQSGELAGAVLDRDDSEQILDICHGKRGWSAAAAPAAGPTA